VSKPAALPLFGDAYLADTTHLTTEEHGAYLLLMIAAWRQPDCALPLEDRKLARIAGLSVKKWASIRDTILEFWTTENGRIFQARLRKEHAYVCQKSEANRKSAEARWNKQVIENKQSDVCERISERNAPPPPPIRDKDDKSSFAISGNGEPENYPPALPAIRSSEVDEAVECWNKAAAISGWPKVLKIEAGRRKKLSGRLREHGLEGWKEALRRAMRSEQLGRDPPSWFSFDFITRNSENILKVLEGNYDKRFGSSGNGTGVVRSEPEFNPMAQAVLARRAKRAGEQQQFFE
jgi:uncharacterized protein YdaU (DUF1376 family)